MIITNKNIFISPLDWGLGHTTRIIPIIKSLQELKANLYIGVNKEQRKLLEEELNSVKYIDFKGYNILYSSTNNMAYKMAIQIPKILLRINQEKKELEKIISKHQIDLIISDNRFGLYSKKIPSIYITHQINIQAPLGIDKVLFELHKRFITNYNQCWIPDFEDSKKSLSGKLSKLKNKNKNYFYIGALSRFKFPSTTKKIEYKYTAIISGPEPQRSIFENKIKLLFKNKKEKCAIIGGLPLSNKIDTNLNIDYFPHLSTSQFLELITISENIICRPGYSSIMDLSILQKPVFFVPTPGQTEQEYLAKYYSKKYKIGTCKQSEIEKPNLLNNFNYLPFVNNIELSKTLNEILKLIN